MTQTFGTPQDAEDAYYDALEEGDMNRLLEVWAETDDISCLLPMYPLVRGRKPVEEAFAHLFSRGQGVTLAISHIDWLEANDMAIHLVEETIQNVPPGQAAPLAGTRTYDTHPDFADFSWAAFLPDGRRIVYSAATPDGSWRTYVQTIPGGKPEPIRKETMDFTRRLADSLGHERPVHG